MKRCNRAGHRGLLVASACGVLMAAQTVSAQVAPQLPAAADPGVIQERSRDIERRLREERERRPDDAPAIDDEALKPAPARPAPAGVRFQLKRVDFTRSELLPEATLRELAAGIEGREVSLAEVQAVVDRINALYRDRGVPTAQAVLPAQDVTDGPPKSRHSIPQTTPSPRMFSTTSNSVSRDKPASSTLESSAARSSTVRPDESTTANSSSVASTAALDSGLALQVSEA